MGHRRFDADLDTCGFEPPLKKAHQLAVPSYHSAHLLPIGLLGLVVFGQGPAAVALQLGGVKTLQVSGHHVQLVAREAVALLPQQFGDRDISGRRCTARQQTIDQFLNIGNGMLPALVGPLVSFADLVKLEAGLMGELPEVLRISLQELGAELDGMA